MSEAHSRHDDVAEIARVQSVPTNPNSGEFGYETLSWRIPEGRSRVSLRFALIQIAFATVVVGFLVIFLTPAVNHSGLLAATIVIALVLAALQGLRAWKAASGQANIWLDDAGLHWRDAAGREQMLSRSLARGFLIGHDEETRRDLASLTLVLKGDFLSQPVELHAPADETRVRKWLQEQWSLTEATAPSPERLSLSLFSELDFHQQCWLLEGERAELQALAKVWSDVALWQLPPIGARPKQLDLEFAGQPLTLAVALHTWLDADYFSASPESLQRLAREINEPLADKSRQEFEISLTTDSGHRWRIIVAVTQGTGELQEL